jgi:outer membrane protein assembly factor BamB
MADEVVRRLVRAARGGDATDALRLARALSRSGRQEEALEALLAGPDDPTVRAEVATFAAWTVPEANGGRTSFLDAPPIEGPPTIAWRKPLAGLLPNLLASPRYVVASQEFFVETGVIAGFDAQSGRKRFSAKVGGNRVSLVDEVVLTGDSSKVIALDARTGRRKFEVGVQGTRLPIEGGVAIISKKKITLLRASATGLEETGSIDVTAAGLPDETDKRRDRVAVTGRRVIVAGGRATIAFDRATHSRLWSAPRGAWLVADHDLVLMGESRGSYERYDGGLRAHDASDGRLLWDHPRASEPWDIVALGPRELVVRERRGERRVLAVHRRTGKVQRTLVPVTPPERRLWIGCLVRGVLYAAQGAQVSERSTQASVSAWRDGDQLWEVPLRGSRGFPEALVPGWGRLFVARAGELTCLTR